MSRQKNSTKSSINFQFSLKISNKKGVLRLKFWLFPETLVHSLQLTFGQQVNNKFILFKKKKKLNSKKILIKNYLQA